MNHHSLAILLSFSKIYFWVSYLVCSVGVLFWSGAVELVFLLLFGIEWMDGYVGGGIHTFARSFFINAWVQIDLFIVFHTWGGVYSFLLFVQKADPPNFLTWFLFCIFCRRTDDFV